MGTWPYVLDGSDLDEFECVVYEASFIYVVGHSKSSFAASPLGDVIILVKMDLDGN